MKGHTRKIALGAAIIAAASYVAGILTAPNSGKQTRKKLRQSALNTKTEAEKTLKKAHTELSDLMVKAKIKATKFKNTADHEFASAITKAQFAKEKARDILSALHDGDADDKDLKNAVKDVSKAIVHLKSYLAKPSPAKKSGK